MKKAKPSALLRSRWPSLLACAAFLSLVIPPVIAADLLWSAIKEPGVGGAVTSISICPTDSKKIVVGGDMLGATYSTDGGQTWNDTFGMLNWECAEATWKPDSTSEVWMATMGGPFKSTDGGRNWVSKRVGMPAPETYWGYNVPIQKIIFDPKNCSRMLAFGGSRRQWVNNKHETAKHGSVWESTNAGESWTQKSIIADEGSGVGEPVNGAFFASRSSLIVFAATASKGVYKSTDGGATWTVKNRGVAVVATDGITGHPTKSNILWRSGSGKRAVYKSTNAGETWTFSGTGLTFDPNQDHSYYQVTVSRPNPNLLFVSNGNWQQIFKSTDGGVNWSDISGNRPATPTSLSFQGICFAPDPKDVNTVFTCNSVTIFKSTDEGVNWTDSSSKPGSGTGLWQGRGFSGYVSTKVKWNPFSPNQCVLQAMDDGKFMQSNDNLTNWRMHGETMNHWHGGNDVTFGGSNGSTIYAALGQDPNAEPPAKSSDGGLTWNYVTNVGSGYSASIYTLPSDPRKVWYIRGGRLYYSSNSGGSWAEISVGGNTDLNQIVADNATTPNIYIAARNGAYKGTPANSFTKIANIEWSEQMRIALDPSKVGRFYLASWRYNQYHCGIYRVDNDTQTRINTNEYVYDVAVDPQNPNRVVMVTNHNPGVEISQATGVWVTENALAANPKWTQQNTGLPMLRGMTIAFHPTNGIIIVGLNGRGYYKTGEPSCNPGTQVTDGLRR